MTKKLNADCLHAQRQRAIDKTVGTWETKCKCGHRLSAHVSGWVETMTGGQCDKCKCWQFRRDPNQSLHGGRK